MVAGQGIVRNYGRNNNSPATGLRQQALDGVRSEVLGMALLLGQGMAAWMKACSATFAVPASGCIPPAAPVPLASDLHGEVVRVLASMALGQTYSRSV